MIPPALETTSCLKHWRLLERLGPTSTRNQAAAHCQPRRQELFRVAGTKAISDHIAEFQPPHAARLWDAGMMDPCQNVAGMGWLDVLRQMSIDISYKIAG